MADEAARQANDAVEYVPLDVRVDPPGDLGQGKERPWGGPLGWLLCLYFRPKRFSLRHLEKASGLTVLLCLWITGFAWALVYYLYPANRIGIPVDEGAPRIFGKAVARGVVAGAVWYLVAGTWYGIRVFLCGCWAATWGMARRAVVFSELVYGLPLAILLSVWWVTKDGTLFVWTIPVTGVFLLWSIYVSFRMARSSFGVVRWAALGLFLGLPLVGYGLLVVDLAGVSRRGQPVEAVAYQDGTFSMQRPGAWRIMESKGDEVRFHIPDGGAFSVRTGLGPQTGEAMDLDEMARRGAQAVGLNLSATISELGTFEKWGGFTGKGCRVFAPATGKESEIAVFCAVLPNGRVLLVMEIALRAEKDRIEPQFEIVRNSLKVLAK